MREDFYRIKRLPPYIFSEINNLKADLRKKSVDIIDFGMGNPDIDAGQHIINKLIETSKKPKVHRYSASRGVPGLRRAKAKYYENRFGVNLDPETEIITTLGSKEGLANLASAITAPGDLALVPNPTYPIHAYGFMIAGGTLRHIPALNNGIFDPEEYMNSLSRAVAHSIPKPIAIVISFPSNPTAQLCDLDFYKELVTFARKHSIWILSDLAYSEIYFDDNPPPSVLQIDGAKEISVEFTSMSKTFSMAGWRVGFAVGNKHLINALTRIKSYLDYGAFTPIQVAAVEALNSPEDYIDNIRNEYKKRRDTLISAMSRAGWEIPKPAATMFAWAPLPKKFQNLGSMEFAKVLMQEAEVAVAPGIGFGEYGEGYVRIGLVENEHRIRQAAKNVKKLISG